MEGLVLLTDLTHSIVAEMKMQRRGFQCQPGAILFHSVIFPGSLANVRILRVLRVSVVRQGKEQDEYEHSSNPALVFIVIAKF